ncbi:oxidoreductase C-terminal domain-containing protein [Streptomyces sp. NPDC051954]|uniref:oxidoreductase C-terminal domain-containing protein n=1 Tax=unclassified Streptomyces TaxID=2593676 RepID=UPI0034358528
MPYFWTDQYGTRIQIYGTTQPGAAVELLDGSLEDGRFVAVARSDGRITAAIGWNDARGARKARQLVAAA